MSPATRSSAKKSAPAKKLAKKVSGARKSAPVKGRGDLSAGSVFGESWQIFSRSWVTFFGVVIAGWLVQMLALGAASLILSEGLANILGMIANWVVAVAVVKAMLDIVDNRPVDVSIVWKKPEVALNFFMASILYGVIVVAGLLLLVVPGVIWSIKFRFFPFLILEQGLGPIEALRESSRLTDGRKLDLFLLDLLSAFLVVLGVLALFVGLFVALPVVSLAKVVMYRRLK